MDSVSSVTILGMRVDCVAPDMALEIVDRFVQERTPRQVVTADASMVVIARQDPELRAIVEKSGLVTPDGAGILWASRLLRTPIPYKVSGVELAERLCERSPAKGYRIFFLGAAPGVAEEAAAKMRQRYPGMHIVGVRDGYFQSAQESEIAAQIKSAAPDILLVALGIPKQEKWIDRHKAALGTPVSIGVGGSFDVFSGRVKRAPLWMQNCGLEWLYRVLKNPRKITKVMTLPQFALLALRNRFWGAA